LRGGDPGVRLIEPPSDAAGGYYSEIPPAFAAQPNKWRIVPLYQIFGGEELSSLAPAIAERAPAPCLLLHPQDAARLGVQDNSFVEVTLPGSSCCLGVRIEEGLPPGVAGLSSGLAGTVGLSLPAWGTLSATPHE
jgi:NADH-quinone oxidoreductase subunit G